MKAIKFFRDFGDGKLGSFYNIGMGERQHPNHHSEVGKEQEFVLDDYAPHRTAFSTVGLRDKSSTTLLANLLKLGLMQRDVKPVVTEVADEETDPVARLHLDGPSERLFKKIKPLYDLIIPGVQQNITEEDIQLAYHTPRRLRARQKFDATVLDKKEEELSEQLETTDNEHQLFKQLEDIDRQRRDHDYNKAQIKSAYRKLRAKGYTPFDIQRAVNILHDDKYSAEIGNMFFKLPGQYEAIQRYVKELEEDPEFVSDMRTKRLIGVARNDRRA